MYCLYLHPTTWDTVLKILLEVIAWLQGSDWAFGFCVPLASGTVNVLNVYSDILTVTEVFSAFALDSRVLLAVHKLSSTKFMLFLDNWSVLIVTSCISRAFTVYS